MNKSIRQLLYKQVISDTQIAGMLAGYRSMPAFFYQKAPSDSRPGWSDPKYPRVDFNIDTRQDPERKTAGTLTVNIWVTTECPAIGDTDPDRAIEARLQELISGTFYTEQDETVCAEWERSDEFEIAGDDTHPEIYGLSITFELLEFPQQITTDPDPIIGLCRWTKKHFGDMSIIGYDDLPAVWKPTDEHPAIYWRFAETASTDRQSYAVVWYNGLFAGHVIAESVKERNRWTKALIERAQIDGEIILLDDSPMFIKNIGVRHGADPLREGQVSLTGQYGVLTQPIKEPAKLKLMNITHTLKEE